MNLTQNSIFRTIWGLPAYSESAELRRAPELLENKLYVPMKDVEIILRFFAVRHVDHYQRGMKGFLDLYMMRAREFKDDDIAHLRHLFEATITLGDKIYGDILARPWDCEKKEWLPRAQVAFADAVMVGLSRHINKKAKLIEKRTAVIDSTRELFEKNPSGTFTGRGNSKKDVQDRITLYEDMLNQHLND